MGGRDKALGQSLLSLQMTGSPTSSADGLSCSGTEERNSIQSCWTIKWTRLSWEGKRSHLSLLSVPSCCLTCSSNTLLSTAHSSFALYDTTLYWFLGRSLTPSKSPYQWPPFSTPPLNVQSLRLLLQILSFLKPILIGIELHPFPHFLSLAPPSYPPSNTPPASPSC